ncbi:MAG TPA: DUF2199 domain-containing protein [Pyrinomonadaceae bacterium]|nr:DUF2199 domain-containing protein [Pyrinomonadaceae bacterium]
MAETTHCHTHGDCEQTFVCSHLTEGTAGLGFNRGEPSDDDPLPNAWCDNCDLIYQAHNGWNDESEALIEVRVVCSGCYELARIRNTRTDVSFEDLANLRWKCGTCEEWHYGPCLAFSYRAPVYWGKENEAANQAGLLSTLNELPSNLLNEDVCILDGEYYFIRGNIHLPIIGTTETFNWGVWGSLSHENFEKFLATVDDPNRAELPPMFSWLSSSIDEYPDTVNIKMFAHIQEPPLRPTFELEPTDHPLSQEYHHGITPERVKEIMIHRLDLPEN